MHMHDMALFFVNMTLVSGASCPSADLLEVPNTHKMKVPLRQVSQSPTSDVADNKSRTTGRTSYNSLRDEFSK